MQANEAADAIGALRALMVPPERLKPGWMFLHILAVLAVSLLPLAVVVAGECLFPRVPAPAAAAAPTATPASLEAEIRAGTGLSPDFVYDLSGEAERAESEKAAATAAVIAGDLAAQKTYRLRVHFLAGLAVLLALAPTAFVAQLRIVRQHTDIIEENVLGPGNRRSADDYRRRFWQRFGGSLVGFALGAWAAVTLVPGLGPDAAGWLETALRVAAALLAGVAAFGLASLFLRGAEAALLGAVALLGGAWLADSALDLKLLAQVTARLDAIARADTAVVACFFAVAAILAGMAVADRLLALGLLRRHALAPLTAAALVLGGVATAEVLAGLSLPGQPRLAAFLAELSLPVQPILAAVAVIAALIVATTAVTLHGNLVAARSFPDTDAVETFAAGHNILTRNDPDARQPDAVWTALRDRAKTHPPSGDGAPVRISLAPKDIEALIRALTLTLAVVMVVALVVLSLGAVGRLCAADAAHRPPCRRRGRAGRGESLRHHPACPDDRRRRQLRGGRAGDAAEARRSEPARARPRGHPGRGGTGALGRRRPGEVPHPLPCLDLWRGVPLDPRRHTGGQAEADADPARARPCRHAAGSGRLRDWRRAAAMTMLRAEVLRCLQRPLPPCLSR